MARDNSGFVIEVSDPEIPAYLQSVDPSFGDWISSPGRAFRFPTRAAAGLAHEGAVDALRGRGATDEQLAQVRVLPTADLPCRRR